MAYSWPVFPVLGTPNYYTVGYDSLEEWRSNMETIDGLIDSGEIVNDDGITTVKINDGAVTTAKMGTGAALGNLADNSVTEAKMDYSGSAFEGAVPVYRAASSKPVYEDITAVVGADTYQVKQSDAGDTPAFVEELLMEFCWI